MGIAAEKNYLVFKGHLPKESAALRFKDFRILAEELFASARCVISRFHLTYIVDGKKAVHKSYQYKENRFCSFETTLSDDCQVAIFYATSKDTSVQNIPFHVMVLPVKSNLFVKVTWAMNNSDAASFIENCKHI